MLMMVLSSMFVVLFSMFLVFSSFFMGLSSNLGVVFSGSFLLVFMMVFFSII